ncbi:hypothetical protein H8356DRAFT_1409778 [Neocallimastix lanati (nom. inval.)]|nr:hypothetical protein H8356DRAFT_1409778 [Neocallimastix sp. JGI-2020a]
MESFEVYNFLNTVTKNSNKFLFINNPTAYRKKTKIDDDLGNKSENKIEYNRSELGKICGYSFKPGDTQYKFKFTCLDPNLDPNRNSDCNLDGSNNTSEIEILNLISSLNLTEHVILKGHPSSNIYSTGWVFVNSSTTEDEDLSLTIGEAGYVVYRSREVISDLKNNIIYGSIVPPQKPNQLAFAQLRVLCMTNGLRQIINKKCIDTLTIEELIKKGTKGIEVRMNDPSIKKYRQELGLLLRKRIIEKLSIDRFCREHEQLLWLSYLSHKREKNMTI